MHAIPTLSDTYSWQHQRLRIALIIIAAARDYHPPHITPNPSESSADDQLEDEGTTESRYLGQNSIAAFLTEEVRAGEPSADGDQDVIRKDIMPILGLQISTAPYPFMSQEDMDKIRLEITTALPSNREVLK